MKSGERIVILELGAEANCCRDQSISSGKLGTCRGGDRDSEDHVFRASLVRNLLV